MTLYHADEAAVRALGYPVEVLPDALRVAVPDTRAVTELIVQNPALFSDYEVVKGRMDDVFLAATGKNLPAGA